MDKERLRELCAKGLNAHQIAARLGATSNAIHEYCKRHGIPLTTVVPGRKGVEHD